MSGPLRGAAVLAVALATSSCTADTGATASKGESASPRATSVVSRALPENWTCREGTFHWGEVTKRETLAAVSDPEEVHIPQGKSTSSTLSLEPVRTLKAAVTPSLPKGSVDAQAAVDALAERTGLDLAAVGTTFTLSKGDRSVTTSSGKFDGVLVAVVGVDTVEASFVYGCDAGGGKDAVRGTLSTWSVATYSGLFKCGIREDLSAVEVEAEALVCGERSGS